MLKILVIRIGRVGDMMMITPAMQALLDSYSDAEFHLLTSADGYRVFKGFSPRLSTFLLHDRKVLLARFKLMKLLRQVRSNGYDHAFCFELNPTFSPFYQAARDGGHCIDMRRPEQHYARRCLDVVQRATSKPLENYWLNLPVTDEARARAKAILAGPGINDQTFMVGMHPTYSGLKKIAWRRNMDSGRRWPVESFAALARMIADYGRQRGLDLRIIMDLVPEEAAIGEEIVRLSGGRVTLLTPVPDFQRYKATLERMDILVTPDTGPMHIAAAVGTRLVALFGATNPNDCGPYVPEAQYQAVQAARTRIASITPEQVFQACLKFLPG